MTRDKPATPPSEGHTSPELVAAVDLGSNSFHMVVARDVEGELQIIDRIKETVRLAGGLEPDGSLDPATRRRALSCLERFGERLAAADPTHVRVVGTNTLRRATRARGFRKRARLAVGHPIEIISGREEARLVYLGVSHTSNVGQGQQLVVDIGGGSTECIIGERFEPLAADSLYMGCVSWSRRYFPGGHVDKTSMRRARMAARQKVEPIARAYKARGWSQALGSSGTIAAVAAVLREQGWGHEGITREGLRKLRRALVATGTAEGFPGLKPERAPVFAGGVAVLSGVFDELEVELMRPAEGALREGVLYDLMGRIRHEDVRDRTIRRLRERFVLDVPHARRVRETALQLLADVAEPWGLTGPWPRTLLRWASELHEVGLAVSYAGHHRHGAYLVRHSDMPGFSRDDQHMLATMVYGHRRKLHDDTFADLPGKGRRVMALRLIALLRISVRLNRSRDPTPLPALSCNANGDRISLRFPEGWLSEHPLTAADLATESRRLARADVDFDFS